MVIRGDWATAPKPKKTVRGGGTIPSPKQRPSGSGNGSIPAPIQRQPTPAYIPPAPSFVPQAPAAPQWNPGSTMGNPGAPMTGFSAPAAPMPVEPPKPTWSMANSNKEIGQVDSTFRDQEAAFLEALQKYIADNTADQGRVERDTDVAEAGIARNRNLGLTGLNEDFAARGLTYSGLRVDARGKADQQYDRQLDNVTNSEADSLRSLKFNRGKYEAENKANIQAAKRDALARLAASQSL